MEVYVVDPHTGLRTPLAVQGDETVRGLRQKAVRVVVECGAHDMCVRGVAYNPADFAAEEAGLCLADGDEVTFQQSSPSHKSRAEDSSEADSSEHNNTGYSSSVPRYDFPPASTSAPQTYKGHTGRVLAVAVSPCGTLAYTCGKDKTVRGWHTATGRPARTYEGHAKRVNALAVSPCAQHLVSGGDDTCAYVWDVAAPEPQRCLKHTSAVTSVAVSSTGRAFAGCADGTVHVWDMHTGAAVSTLRNHAAAVTGLALSRCETLLLTGSADHSAKVCDASSFALQRELLFHDLPLLGLALSPTTGCVCSWDSEMVVVWDPQDSASGCKGTLQPRSARGKGSSLTAVAVSPAGPQLLSAYSNHTVCAWNVNSMTPDGSRQLKSGFDAAAFSPCGRYAFLCKGSVVCVESIADATAPEWNGAKKHTRKHSRPPTDLQQPGRAPTQDNGGGCCTLM